MNKKLIETKLTKLQKLLAKTDEARVIESDNPETWDLDTLYNLAEELKEALTLLEDKKSKQIDEYGELIVLESGLCSLVDEYNSENE